MLVNLGYEGRSAQEVVDALVMHGVEILVDVRLTPISRKPGLSKSALSEALAAAGIKYVHCRGLGNPRDNREAFAHPGAPRQQARERFRARLNNGSRDSLGEIAALARKTHVALLCYERKPSACHRDVIVEEAQRIDPAIVALPVD